MNTIERLNNIINYIDSNKNKKRIPTSLTFDDLNLNLNVEIVVGSKVNIQSEENNFNLTSELKLENYLKSINSYKKYRDKSPKYAIDTIDLGLDIDLEIKQKYLIEKPVTLRKTPDDIKRDISITLLENLKTSIFLYDNLDKEKKYIADFKDLHLDVELEYKEEVSKTYYYTKRKKVHENEADSGEKNIKINTNNDKVSILKEKLKNIEKFRKDPKYHSIEESNNLDIGVTINRTGNQLISLNKKNKINKLKQLLESINSYKERRNEL